MLPNVPRVPAWRFFIFALGLGVIILRFPLLLTQPRFWAEEGVFYFAKAYALAGSPAWHTAFFQVQRGYFSLWPNIATTLAANFFPLEYAPLITTLSALFIQAAAIALMLWADSSVWRAPIIKILGCLVILFVPLSGEVWLNTVNSQFVLGVISFLILCARANPAKPSRWVYRALLIVAGLSGLVSTFLLPVFALAAVLERSKERLAQTLILLVCLAIQGAIMLEAMRDPNSLMSMRGGTTWITFIATAWSQSIGLVSLGLDNMRAFFEIFSNTRASNPAALGSLTALLAILIILYLVVACANLKKQQRVIILGGYLLVITASIFGAVGDDRAAFINPGFGGRYFFATNIFLLLMALGGLQNVMENRSAKLYQRIFGVGAGALLALALFWGIRQFMPTTLASPGWPNWQQQVQKWRNDPTYAPEIWPPPWKITNLAHGK